MQRWNYHVAEISWQREKVDVWQHRLDCVVLRQREQHVLKVNRVVRLIDATQSAHAGLSEQILLGGV